MSSKPVFITGGLHNDHRGTISFINNFNLDDVKRFYVIEPENTDAIRAWQGHKLEQKWFYVVAGSFKFVAVKIDDWDNPGTDLEVFEINLKANNPIGVLYLPGGYANGFKALEVNSRVMVFSDFTIQQSMNDDYRFDQNKWFDWHQ